MCVEYKNYRYWSCNFYLIVWSIQTIFNRKAPSMSFLWYGILGTRTCAIRWNNRLIHGNKENLWSQRCWTLSSRWYWCCLALLLLTIPPRSSLLIPPLLLISLVCLSHLSSLLNHFSSLTSYASSLLPPHISLFPHFSLLPLTSLSLSSLCLGSLNNVSENVLLHFTSRRLRKCIDYTVEEECGDMVITSGLCRVTVYSVR